MEAASDESGALQGEGQGRPVSIDESDCQPRPELLPSRLDRITDREPEDRR
jgi:hypothetical protein